MHEPFSFTRVDFTIPLAAARIQGITTGRAKKEGTSLHTVLRQFNADFEAGALCYFDLRKRGVIVWEYPDGDDLFPHTKISPYRAPIPVFRSRSIPENRV